MYYKTEIDSSDIKKIEAHLKSKGLQLNNISYSINGFAIANVYTINCNDDSDDFEPSLYTVVIDVNRKQCCKFNFYGHKTNGIKIFAKPRKGKFRIDDACFDIKFITTIDGESTPYMLISYNDFNMNYDSRCDDGNYEGYIYTCIYNFSNENVNFNNSFRFKFDDFCNFDNSVEVCQIDIEDSSLFAYKLCSKCQYDSEYDISREDTYDFDGVWNKSLYCTDKRIIPLNDENFWDIVENINCEIKDELSQEFEERERLRYEELSWKLEQDMMEYDNRAFNAMIDDYEAWGNLD